MRKAIISLVVALASFVPAEAISDGMPASSAKSTGKDASARSPAAAPAARDSAQRVTQADLQPDAPGEYTVQKGDTLWGIAGRFLKDPWKWPQIWNMNKDQIRDPHWIYPGDVIRLDRTGEYPTLGLGTGGSADAAANVVRLEPRIRVEPLETAIPTIPGSVIGPFLAQPLVVELGALDTAPAIVATEEGRVIIGAGDTAYADRITAVDAINWQVYRAGRELRDPDTGEVLGLEAKHVGDARVRRYGPPATLEITKARLEINRGDRLMPARDTAVWNYVPRAPGKEIRGTIMGVDDGVSELGQFQIVSINRGARDGIETGHVLASYRRGAVVQATGRAVDFDTPRWLQSLDLRPNPVVPEPPPPPAAPGAPASGAPLQPGPLKLPDERSGLLFVFRVFDKMSYALVMRTTRPIHIGDMVRTP